MQRFFTQLLFFLDKDDRKFFIWLIWGLLINGIIAVIGIGSVIPLILVLMNPDKLKQIPYIGSVNFNNAIGLCIGVMIFAFSIKNFFGFIIVYLQSKFQTSLAAKIRKDLFKTYLYSNMVFHKNNNVTQMVNNVSSQIESLTSNVVVQFGVVLTESITVVIILGILVFVYPVLIIFLLSSMFILIGGYSYFIRKKSKKFQKLRADNLSVINQLAVGALGGVKETKLYHKEGYFTEQFNCHADELKKMEHFFLTTQQSSRFVLELTAVVLMLSAVYLLGVFGKSRESLMIVLSVFSLVAAQLLPSLNRLLTSLTRLQICLPLLTQMHHVVNQARAEVIQLDQDANSNHTFIFNQSLRLDKITFYYGDKLVLDRISLNINKNSKVAIVGESGAGKSTLADILMCLLTPKSGDIYIDDTKLLPSDSYNWHKYFGYIPQDIYIYDSTICKNIACYMNESQISEDNIWQALKFAGLDDWVKTLPNGIHAAVGENGKFLSGGQKRRIGIARAIFQNPQILVMDEATTGLDPQTEEMIVKDILSRNITIITISHRLDLLKYYDLIYVIKDNVIAKSGNYSYLLENSTFFKNSGE